MKLSKTHAIIVIMLLALFVRTYNAGGLSGGDDSAYGSWIYFAFEDPMRFLYLDIPDEPTWHKDTAFIRNFSLWPIAPFVFLFGFNAIALKLPSLLFSLATIPLLYIFINRYFGKKISLASCLLFAVAPLHVAFTRVAFIDGTLTFYALSVIYLVTTGIEQKKIWMFYAAGGIGLVTLLTTNFRGVVPMAAIVPFILASHLKWQQWKHLILAGIFAFGSYIIYPLIPLLWGDARFLDRFTNTMVHSSINMAYSHAETAVELIKYLYVTPFLGLLLVPALFGVYYCIENWKRPINLLLLGYLASTIAFYAHGQPVPSRQASMAPIYAILAAIAFYKIRSPKLFRYTAAYILFSIPLSLAIIPEFAEIRSTLIAYFGAGLFNIGVGLVVFACVVLVLVNVFDKLINRYARFLTNCYMALSVVLILGLVMGGFGVFHRSAEIHKVANYLENNLEDETYGCIAGIHEKTLRYLLQRDCATWRYIDVEWMEENKKDLKYLLLNHEYTEGSFGLGNIAPDGTILRDEPGTFREYRKDMHEWVLQNSIDVTSQTGVDPNKFTIRKINS